MHELTSHVEVCRREQIARDIEVLSVCLPLHTSQTLENVLVGHFDQSKTAVTPLQWTFLYTESVMRML